jgi:RecJ-like exonuclease
MIEGPSLYVEDGVYENNIKYLPYKWNICPTCHGEGTRRLVSEEYVAEMDEEEYEDFLAGRYDTVCNECQGTGKIKVLDESRCTPEELEEYRRQEFWRRSGEAESAAERRLGA